MADTKTMAEGSKEVGRTVPVTTTGDSAPVPGDYHDYQGSSSKSAQNSYDGRMSALESALGNKDSVKG